MVSEDGKKYSISKYIIMFNRVAFVWVNGAEQIDIQGILLCLSVLSFFFALLFTFGEYTGLIKLLDANKEVCLAM